MFSTRSATASRIGVIAAAANAAASLMAAFIPAPKLDPEIENAMRKRAVQGRAWGTSGWGSEPGPCGRRARDRRLRQIEAGQLKAENGLDVELSERLRAQGRI